VDTDLVLDGNAVAGVLGELFQRDLTMATGTCRGCGLSGPLAQTRVYGQAPGAVVRCPGCGGVLLTIVAEGGRYWLGFDRLRCLEIDAASD
jgi:ribosomal protein S27E